MKSHALPSVLAGFLVVSSACAQQNLIPNWNFASVAPLKSWRVDFPSQDGFKHNVTCVKQARMEGKRCAAIELPSGLAEHERAKLETALVPAVPGATYRVEAEALLPDFGAKIQAEAYAADPRDEGTRKDGDGKGAKVVGSRIPEGDGHPALVMVYRVPLPELERGGRWDKVEREFTLPVSGMVAGRPAKPLFLIVKALTGEVPQSAGRGYFTDFKLFKVKDATPLASTSKKD
jgi:hypothetical protein